MTWMNDIKTDSVNNLVDFFVAEQRKGQIEKL
jgi:hypothetical protein